MEVTERGKRGLIKEKEEDCKRGEGNNRSEREITEGGEREKTRGGKGK